MRQFLLLTATITGLCIPLSSPAQSDRVIAPHILADTSRAMQLTIRCGLFLRQKKYTEAKTAAEEAVRIYTQSGTENHQAALAWQALEKVHFYHGDIDEAIRAGETSAAIFKKIYPEKHPKVAQSYHDLGLLYSGKRKFERSFELLNKALELQTALGDSCALPLTLRSIAVNHLELGNSRDALELLLRAHDISIRCHTDTTWGTIARLNEIGITYGHLGQPYKQIEYLETVHAWFRKFGQALNPDDLSVAIQGLDNLSMAYGDIGRFDLAVALARETLDLRLKYQGNSRSKVPVAYNNLATAYTKKGDFKLAIHFLEKALARLPEDEHLEELRASFYSNLGVCYGNLGDIGRAIEYQELALRLRLKNLPPGHPDLAGTYHNLASNYAANGDTETAISFFNSAIETFRKSQGTAHPAVALFYSGLSHAFDQAGKCADAIQYCEQALELFDGIYHEGHPSMINPLLNLGEWYAVAGAHDSAIQCVRKAIVLQEKFYGSNHAGMAACRAVLGSVLQIAGKYPESEATFQEAIAKLDAALQDSVVGMDALIQVVAVSRRAAEFYQNRHLQTPDPALLLHARNHYAQALAALNRLSRSVSPASKSTLAAQASDICVGAISTSLRLHTSTDSLRAFDFAERSKAFLLLEAMKDADALHIAGIPDSLLELERNLRLEIAFFEKLQQEKRDSIQNRADTIAVAIGSKLLDLKNRHEELIQLFEDRYPEYYQAKYGLATAGVAEVQQMLRPGQNLLGNSKLKTQNSKLHTGQTLLEYTIGDSAIFAFVIRPDHFSVHELPRDFPLEQTVDALTRLGMYAYYTLPKDKRSPALERASVRNYTNAARLLYDKLVAPVAEHLTEDLLIVPDGVLGYVPFEALLSGEPARPGVFTSYEPHFLLNRHRISYSASATLLREMRDKRHRHEPQATVLALAPFFREDTATMHTRVDSADPFALRDAFGPLPASGGEVYAVAKLLGGSALYGPDASLDAFRQRAPQHRILHLSTHGKADDRLGDYTYLALGVPGDTTSFEKLYARDLYGIGLNADLVVLSACETATGKLRRGEGIVSLARAFSFAGAKSLVTTLWKVDDTATKDLMTGFYRHLRDGVPKDTALRQAKFDYWGNNREMNGGAKLHPFFWAGFVAIGDMQPLK